MAGGVVIQLKVDGGWLGVNYHDEHSGKPPVFRMRSLIAEPVGDDIGVMTESGDVKLFADPEGVVIWSKRRDARSVRHSEAVIVTRIEWRGMPDDFTPPEGSDPR